MEMLATCHGLAMLGQELVGDPLDQKLFEATGVPPGRLLVLAVGQRWQRRCHVCAGWPDRARCSVVLLLPYPLLLHLPPARQSQLSNACFA